MKEFYWPGVVMDVVRHCRSHNICQRTIEKGRVRKAPMNTMPLFDTPFKRIDVDIIEPIEPMTDRRNRCILTLVDYPKRYPEAIIINRVL